MKDLNYTNVKEQEYESISDNINIIGDILEQWDHLTVNLWGSGILKIINIEEPEELKLPKRLIDTEYGNIDLNTYLQNTTANLKTIDEVRKITDKLPSLTKILLEARNDD